MDFIATIADSIQLNFPVLVDHKYILLLLLSSLEGLSGIILAGLLASLGVVEIVPAVIICLIGDFINGWLWYSVGYFGGAGSIDRWGRKHPKSREIIETIERYFHLYSGRVIVLTKITWSVTIFAMIVAGAFRYNLKKFALYNLIGALVGLQLFLLLVISLARVIKLLLL